MMEIVTLLALIVAAAALYSRHRLHLRHKAAKVALNRVAGERDEARFKLALGDKGQ
jgi:hypothetical protein